MASFASSTRCCPPSNASTTRTRSWGRWPAWSPSCPASGTVQYTHVVARLQPGALGQLDQPVALARAEIIDNLVGNACRLDAIHDQTDDAEAPTGGVPLRLDGEETVTRKERRSDLNLASM